MKKTSALLLVLIATLFFLSCKTLKNTSKTVVTTNNIKEIQHIRNASIIITFNNNLKLIVDPVLSDKATESPMPFSNENKNPLLSLPIDKNTILKGIDAVLLSHYHTDHFDIGAETYLPKNILIFCQPYDYSKLRDKGFTNLQIIENKFQWKGIRISRFLTSHHKGATGAPPFGESSSFYLETENESLFITGDAILDTHLTSILTEKKPKVIVANTGECQFTQNNSVLAPNITMTLTKEELNEISNALPKSKLIAIHMDAINHCSLGKNDLRDYFKQRKHIFIPNEGDTLSYTSIINN